jgi:hypothetical protein
LEVQHVLYVILGPWGWCPEVDDDEVIQSPIVNPFPIVATTLKPVMMLFQFPTFSSEFKSPLFQRKDEVNQTAISDSEVDQGAGLIIDQGSKTLTGKRVAFDAEITAIVEALKWFQEDSNLQHLVIHSDSTSAIARASHSGARPGQQPARAICGILSALEHEGNPVGQRTLWNSRQRAHRPTGWQSG